MQFCSNDFSDARAMIFAAQQTNRNSPGEQAEGGKELRQQAGEIMACECNAPLCNPRCGIGVAKTD